MLKLYHIFILQLLLITTAVAETAETYGPVKSGEMLWMIAGKVHATTEITRYQSIIALLQANPQAFSIQCNFNSLKVGAILTIPQLNKFPFLSSDQALNEFNRQNTEWKAYRQGQAIQCVAPATTTGTSELTEIKKPLPPVLPQVIVPATPKILPPPQKSTPLEISPQFLELIQWLDYRKLQAQLAQQPSGFIAASIIVIGLGTLIILWFVRLLYRIISGKPKTSMSLPSISEDFFSHSYSPLVAATNAVMEERLSSIRLGLARGELQKVPDLIQEVEQKGTAIQQFEARQLAEIYKKMTNLQEEFQKTQKLLLIQQDNASSKSPPVEKTETQSSEYLPQRYLPENKEKMFELVDTVIQVLDKELQAQGQLLEAYQQRHQPILESEDYQLVNQVSKLDESEGKLDSTASSAKSTRYL
ncbi:MAG: FimV/HubP family polar landmark protein [Thiotrichaceae bacterium]